MPELVCPDAGPDGPTCWVVPDIGVDEEVVEFFRRGMHDGFCHELAHSLDGPAFYGYNDDGSPSFEVYRDDQLKWGVRAKTEHRDRFYGPKSLDELIDQVIEARKFYRHSHTTEGGS